ncbi:hypothetical protein ACOMHN_056704 [Nucella lapillus]
MTLYVKRELKPSLCDKLKTEFSENIFVECHQDDGSKLLVEERSEGRPHHAATKFLKVTRDAFLIQHQKEPTRFRKGEKSNVVDLIFTNRDDMVDLIFTNRDDMVDDTSTAAGIGRSDHFALVINLNCTFTEPPRTKRFNYQRTDVEKLETQGSTRTGRVGRGTGRTTSH